MAKKPEVKRTLSNLNTRTGPDKNKFHFQYWADGLDWDWDRLDEEESESKSAYYLDKVMHLASLRRAAANFVRILTGDDQIRVTYSSGKDSYTDGRTVVISAEENPAKFDKTVAVALHEASHCLLTDFAFATIALKRQPSWFFPDNDRFRVRESSYSYVKTAAIEDAALIMNVIEDRRIDDFIYRTAVGYRPYYDVLYNELWNSKEVGKALRYKKEWRKPSRQAYLERIINISNPVAWETQDALPGIREIYELIDLKNIRRFNAETVSYRQFGKIEKEWRKRKSPADVLKVDEHAIPDDWREPGKYQIRQEYLPEIFKVTIKILDVIYQHVFEAEQSATPKSGKGSWKPDTLQEPEEGGLPNEDLLEESVRDLMDQLQNESEQTEDESGEGESGDEDEDGDGDEDDLEPVDKNTQVNEKKLNKELQKIHDFVNGEQKKKKIEKNIAKDVEAMDTAAASVHAVGNEVIGRGRVLVTERLSMDILNSAWWQFSTSYNGAVYANRYSGQALLAGIRMGQILTHRLQVRNEQTVTKFPNQLQGNIDRRVLARLGMEIETVFSRRVLDQYQPALIHLSLDASGSMSGNKWSQTISLATALVYAGHKISNLDVVVSLRGGVRNDTEMAHMAIIHDTRKDQFAAWRRYVPYLSPNGGTPEGLCFEAIMDEILKDANDYSMYFINISDGQPAFNTTPVGTKQIQRRRRYYYSQPKPQEKGIDYGGPVAVTHTRHQVNKMREAGIRVLSYFVSESRAWNESSSEPFRAMYGEDASFIDVTKVAGIVTTMNRLLLRKS